MRTARRPATGADGEPERPGSSSRWVSRISRDQERRLYFLATVVLAAWYLVARLL
jgi:hypothetical protein